RQQSAAKTADTAPQQSHRDDAAGGEQAGASPFRRGGLAQRQAVDWTACASISGRGCTSAKRVAGAAFGKAMTIRRPSDWGAESCARCAVRPGPIVAAKPGRRKGRAASPLGSTAFSSRARYLPL